MNRIKCHHVDEAVPHLRESYRRFALVTSKRHLDRLDVGDPETLIVTSNWLLWQDCLRRGLHCVHSHLGMVGWDTRELDIDLFLLTNDWLYVDGKDATLFHGVSLGRKFVREVSLVIGDYERIKRSLETLTERFRPQEYIYFHFRTDTGFLNAPDCFDLVRSLADRSGIKVTDRGDPLAPDDPEFPVNQHFGVRRRSERNWMSRAVDTARTVFELLVDPISRFRRLLGRNRPGVLILNSHLNALPLFSTFDGKDVYPMVLAKWFPGKRDVGFLISSLAKGILLVGAPRRPLSPRDRRAVDGIEQRLLDALATPASGRDIYVRRHVQERILKPGRLNRAAVEVNWGKRLLERHRPGHILTDGLQNPTTNTILELAKDRAIPASACWHGPFVQDVKLEIFGSDPRVEPLVERCLTWGRVNEDWLDSISARTAKVRVGNLAAARFRDTVRAPENRRHALLLQYAVTYNDFATVTSTEYQYFVEVVQILRDLKYREIRFKLHPGAPKGRYYERIAERFGLECQIFETGSFEDFVAWSDIVVGPVVSGAMLEVMAAGRPYYPVLLSPHAVNTSYLGSCTVYGDFKALRQALESGQPPECGACLNDFTSIDEFSDPAARTWQALRSQVKPT